MRILHISTRLILGGSQENTALSCEGQARLGHDVHLAFGPIYGPEGSLLDRVENFRTPDGRRITTHIVPHMVREVAPFADRRALSELRNLIRDIRPDIVHTHSSKAGILGRIAAWPARRPFERGPEAWAEYTAPDGSIHRVFVNESVKPPPGSRMTNYVRATIRSTGLGVIHTIHGPPFMPVEGPIARRTNVRLNNLIYTLAERHAARRCHLIVSVAEAMTRQFLARGIGRPDQYITVRSGMETAPFLHAAPGETRDDVRRELGFKDSDFVIGTVARLAEHKGHDDLLDALADDLRRNPHWKLLWVGDGWWRDRLLAKARGMGLTITELDKSHPASPPHLPTSSPPQIVLTGLVPPQRIPALMRAMGVLAHPSYREGLPRTVPQALLAGVCPVAYDVDGTGEACRDMETGRLVPLADLPRLREAIEWCATHPQERQALVRRGQQECAELFSAEKMVTDLEQVYARALNSARGAGF